MIHANRFGEYEERCAGGVYLTEAWIQWLDQFTDVRNTLSCYLRTVIGLMDICVFQRATAALVGFHITVSFMTMLLDYKVTQRELLDILPKLYTDLLSYETSLIKLDGPSIKALTPFWRPPFDKTISPYGVDVMEPLKPFTDTCNQEVKDKSLKYILKHMAVTLKRQRGNAYNFGDDIHSDEHITKNFPSNMMDDPDATHSKPVENYFGNLDCYLAKTGPQGFDKVIFIHVYPMRKRFVTSDYFQ